MTSHQVELVQNSFKLLGTNLDAATMMFYDRLFQLDGSLRPMFRAPLAQQAHKMADMLALVVNGLDRPHEILPSIKELGKRHAGYGVLPQHYGTVGTALLWTLEAGLGDVFTVETREAWSSAYALIASTMQDAATEAETVDAFPA